MTMNTAPASRPAAQRLKLALIALASLALGACATPVPKELVTPEFGGQAPANVNVGMTDHRTFILSGDKEEWFEGIFHGAFGIPSSLQRPGPKTGQPFAVYLSDMLADGLRASGSEVAVVAVPMGTDTGAAISTVMADGAAAGIVFRIIHSRYVVGWGSAEYRHHFDVTIVDPAGASVLQKSFSRFDTDLPLSADYNLFDMYATIYKKTLDEVMNDPEVAAALAGLAAAQSS